MIATPPALASDVPVDPAAPPGIAVASELPDILPAVKLRGGVVGFAWRHPAIAIGSALLLAMLLRPLALAVNCLPVPAALTCRPEKLTRPLPAAVPISSDVVPRSEPVPALTLRVTS